MWSEHVGVVKMLVAYDVVVPGFNRESVLTLAWESFVANSGAVVRTPRGTRKRVFTLTRNVAPAQGPRTVASAQGSHAAAAPIPAPPLRRWAPPPQPLRAASPPRHSSRVHARGFFCPERSAPDGFTSPSARRLSLLSRCTRWYLRNRGRDPHPPPQ